MDDRELGRMGGGRWEWGGEEEVLRLGDLGRPTPFRKRRGQKDKMSPLMQILLTVQADYPDLGLRQATGDGGLRLCRQVSCGRMCQESWKRGADAAVEVGKDRREGPPIQANQKLERLATQRGSRGACERGSLECKSLSYPK